MSRSPLKRFYSELKRRKVIRVAVAYVIVSWVIVEAASVMFPELLLPDWSVRLLIALVAAGFPIALVLAWAFDIRPDPGPELPADDQALTLVSAPEYTDKPGADSIESIAVLPFVNLSNDAENEYFSDGMSEELLNLLCKLPQLTVASRTSSFSFKGKDKDIVTIARQLHVDVVLEGSVRRSGERVRITAQLIDGRSDRHLWSGNYDRELTDVFAVQDEIAQNIVDALKLSLTPEQQQSISRPAATDNIDAYDFYLRGRYFVERGDVDSGQRMFEKAIELDESYALAWAGAADCHSWRCQWYESAGNSLELSDECSRKALELAPGLAEAHASRLHSAVANSNYAEAEAAFKAAVELDPQLYEAYYYVGRAYFAQGKFREAADAFRQAGVIRPDDLTAATLRATALKALGQSDEWREARKQSIEIAERYLALNPDDALAWSRVAHDLINDGQVEKGLEWAERAYSINPSVCRYNVACAYMVAGNKDRSLDLLEEHARARAVNVDWLLSDSDWEAARDDPRFLSILDQVRKQSEKERHS
jgi:adenylate cyclase